MKRTFTFLLALFCFFISFSQEDGRSLLRGKVMYKNTNVQNQNVINVTTEKATITDDNGEFAIYVKAGDVLAFSAVNYKLTTVNIDEGIIRNNRLVVEVNEKVTELEEVVVTPENQEKFIQLKSEEFKRYDYAQDHSTEVVNLAIPQGSQYNINFVNIFKAIFKSKKKEEVASGTQLKMSDVLRQLYEDNFFVNDLGIPQDKINEFLYFCDDRMPAENLLKKDKEFELIDFLVEQSKSYLKVAKSEN